jgi:hypothetical protein
MREKFHGEARCRTWCCILVYGDEPAAWPCEMVNELPCSFWTAGIHGPNVRVTSILYFAYSYGILLTKCKSLQTTNWVNFTSMERKLISEHFVIITACYIQLRFAFKMFPFGWIPMKISFENTYYANQIFLIQWFTYFSFSEQKYQKWNKRSKPPLGKGRWSGKGARKRLIS